VSILQPEPGDFAVVSVSGQGGALISAMERIAYDHSTHWDHAFIYIGQGCIVQAMTGGAETAPLGSYAYAIWSTGILFPTAPQRRAIVAAANADAARKVPYSYLDYAAIAAHRFHIPAPGLREYIASTSHLICSQLVDQCWADAGYHLFDDGRWPGYVSPFDLGQMLTEKADG
jgi:hypothetical protein